MKLSDIFTNWLYSDILANILARPTTPIKTFIQNGKKYKCVEKGTGWEKIETE